MKKKQCWLIGLCVLMLVLVSSGLAEGSQNLVPNGGFETLTGEGKPADWFASAYRAQQGYSRIVATDEKAHTGSYSALVENANENDARFVCNIVVQPESLYRFSGYIFVEDMEPKGNGANLALEDLYAHSLGLFDTGGQWKYVECYGETGPGQHTASIGVRVGGYGAESLGKAYFDDIAVEKVSALPAGMVAEIWYKTKTEAPAVQEAGTGQPTKSTGWFVLLGGLFVMLVLVCGSLWDTPQELPAPEGLKKKEWRVLLVFGLFLLAAMALRVVLAANVHGYEVDINCFRAWSLRMAEVGPTKFYEEGYFCDYPPGAMLLLWPIGLLLHLVPPNQMDMVRLVVKLTPILLDMVGALFLFAFAKKRISMKAALLLSLLYALNPATLVNGAAWGQMDSVLAFLMMVTAYFAMERKWKVALPLFVVGALVKPQALLLAPVGLLWLVASLVMDAKRSRQFVQVLWGLILSIGCALLVALPFSLHKQQPLLWLVGLYGETLGSYGYATLNTANLYYLFAANWVNVDVLMPLGQSLTTGLLLAAVGGWQVVVSLRRGAFAKKAALTTIGKASRKANKKAIQTSQRNALAVEDTGRNKLQKHFFLGLSCAVTGMLLAVLALAGVSYGTFGTILMVFVFLWTAVCCFLDHSPEKLPFYMALALIGVYVLGIKIHERYLFLALPLLLMAYAATRDKRMLGLCVGFSVTTFINTAIVLDNSILFGAPSGHLNNDTLLVNITLAVMNLLLCLFAGYVSFSGVRASKAWSDAAAEQAPVQKPHTTAYREGLLSPRDARLHLSGKDWLIMGVVTVLYACLTFSNLGSMKAPQTGWVATSPEEAIVFEIDAAQPFSLVYYAGVSYSNFSVAVSQDNVNWSQEYACDMREGLCYRWQYAIKEVEGAHGTFMDNNPDNILWLTGKYLRLTAGSAGLNLFEIIARNSQGQVLPMQVVGHTGAKTAVLTSEKPPENLLDEQNTMEGEPSWFNGTYFDEIYHARTAYEHLHGQPPYETTHPPLGKLMMSAAIAVFGMTPFGWRFAGAFVGVLMLPALYLLAKQLTRRRDLATFAMLLLTFDLMHFTQTRIATIDSFPVLFILLSYLCMARYMMTDVFALPETQPQKLLNRTLWRSLIPLGLSGLFMGLSIASKWIGLYSAVGLAVLFFVAIFRQYRMGNIAFEYSDTEQEKPLTQGQKDRVQNAQEFALKRIFITCGFCLVFFLAVPALIYYLSYIPYLAPTGAVTLQRLMNAQTGMLSYHSTPGLGMNHPFQSPWWQWPFILKPMWFNQDKFEPAGFSSTILCMGNPVIFYVGALCMVAVFGLFLHKYISLRRGLHLRSTDGDMALPVLVVGFMAQYLPWVLVPRSMYIYHYFASVPFIILATAWVMNFLPESKPRLRYGVMWGFVALAVVAFIAFFPFASGILTPNSWMEAMQWFKGLYY